MESKEKEFLKIVDKLKITVCEKDEKKSPWAKQLKSCKKATLDGVIYEKWCTGGITGGGYSDQSNYYAQQGEQEPDFIELDNLLTEICPNITYLQYKKLIAGLIELQSWTEDEYYGNSSTYSCKIINLRKLFEKLLEMKLMT